MSYTIKMKAGEIVTLGNRRIEYRKGILERCRQNYIDWMMKREKKILGFGTGKYYTEAEAQKKYETAGDMFGSPKTDDEYRYYSGPLDDVFEIMKSAERCEPDFIIEVPGEIHRELTAPTDGQ